MLTIILLWVVRTAPIKNIIIVVTELFIYLQSINPVFLLLLKHTDIVDNDFTYCTICRKKDAAVRGALPPPHQ